MFRRSSKTLARALPALAAALALAGPPPAAAAPSVSLETNVSPLKLGVSTTLSFGFHVSARAGQELTPLSDFSVRLPEGMGFAATTLGLATCSRSTLLAAGAGACPRESLMGFGSAQIRAPFGTQVVRETARISIFMARPVERRTTMLTYFDGRRPVIAPLVMRSQVFSPRNSADSLLTTTVPSIPTAPDAPNVALVDLRASIGPRNLRYFKRVGGRIVAYRPEGLSLPERCPQGGFVFPGQFHFEDGSRTATKGIIPCPPDDTRRHHQRG